MVCLELYFMKQQNCFPLWKKVFNLRKKLKAGQEKIVISKNKENNYFLGDMKNKNFDYSYSNRN